MLPPNTRARSAGRRFSASTLRKFDAGVEPGTVGAEEDFLGAGALHGLFQQIEAAYAGGVGVEVGVTGQGIDVACWAAQSSEKLPRWAMMKLTSGYSVASSSAMETSPVGSYRTGRPEGAGGFADFAGDAGVVTVHLDADEAVLLHGGLHELADTAAICLGMDEGEAIEPVGLRGDDARHFAIGDGVVGVECGEQYGALYTGPAARCR